MKYSKIKYIFTAFIVICALQSCDQGFEDLNKNPNNPATIPSELLTADIVRSAANNLYTTFLGGDMGAIWAQHWTKVQYNDEERYSPRETIIESFWTNIYEDVISDAKSMELLALAEENPAQQAVGLILQAYGFSLLTDAYGDIPFTDAIKGSTESNFTPAYDSQETVYNGIISLLDQANDLINSGAGSIGAGADLLYGGDASKWQKFANSLQFRSLMRISSKTDVSAKLTELLSRPMFTSNDDEAKLVYLSTLPNANPIFETVDITAGARGEWKVNSVMVDMLVSMNDPRLPLYVGLNNNGEYRGKPSGYRDVPNDDYNYANVSPIGPFYLAPTLPGYFVSFSELLFLHAEAAAKGLISGDAATYYAAAIASNFEANGIAAGATAYIDAHPYTDEESIALQKYIALYGQGFEAWTEWRRTKVPALTPAVEGTIDQIPSRYKYPGIEQSLNKANYDAAVSGLGGENTLTAKIWWLQ